MLNMYDSFFTEKRQWQNSFNAKVVKKSSHVQENSRGPQIAGIVIVQMHMQISKNHCLNTRSDQIVDETVKKTSIRSIKAKPKIVLDNWASFFY